ncbi:MAG: hypothetical protein F4X80_02965 [Chloroflexi bacterium]|nr:hypothetical protein [Chloroflexota bacterium]
MADTDSRRRLGEALDAYYYGEFAGVVELLTWFLSQEDRGPEWWRPTFILAVAVSLGGVWHLCEECRELLPLLGLALLTLGLCAGYVLMFGSLLASLCLGALGSRIRASLDHRIRMRLATLLARREAWFPPGHSARESWAEWRHDLEAISRGGGSPQLGHGGWLTVLSTVATLATFGGGTWVVVGREVVPSLLVPALALGLVLIVVAFLTARANSALFEHELQSALGALSQERRDVDHLTLYPSSMVIDVIAVTGAVLSAPALVVAGALTTSTLQAWLLSLML